MLGVRLHRRGRIGFDRQVQTGGAVKGVGCLSSVEEVGGAVHGRSTTALASLVVVEIAGMEPPVIGTGGPNRALRRHAALFGQYVEMDKRIPDRCTFVRRARLPKVFECFPVFRYRQGTTLCSA